MWKILICDDNTDILQSLTAMVLRCADGYTSFVRGFSTPEQLLFELDEQTPDSVIVMMDIDLNAEINGIELADAIKKKNANIQIIFISAYDSYFEDAYDVEHVFFLKKPFDSARLKKALMLAGEKADAEKEEIITVVTRNAVYNVPQRDILYIESNKRLLLIHTADETFSMYGSFAELDDKLNETFFRCHVSFIVNFLKVKALDGHNFIMQNGENVAISRVHLGEAKKQFLIYLGNKGRSKHDSL